MKAFILSTLLIFIFAAGYSQVASCTASKVDETAKECVPSAKESCAPGNTKIGEARVVTKLISEYNELKKVMEEHGITTQRVDHSKSEWLYKTLKPANAEDFSIIKIQEEVDGVWKYFSRDNKHSGIRSKAQLVQELRKDIETLFRMVSTDKKNTLQ